MVRTPDTGYEGHEDEEELAVTYRLESDVRQYALHGVICRVMRNDIPVGMIRAGSVREAEWLKERLKGTYESEGGG